jgi:hypothetical protein
VRGEGCVGSVFFDIIVSHWANVMYCSKAECTLFACVSVNIHHDKQHLKKNSVFLVMVKHLWGNESLFWLNVYVVIFDQYKQILF